MTNQKTIEFYLNLIKSGKKLEAVKIYCTENKCGLKEAKEYIDNLEENNKAVITVNMNDNELIQLLKIGKKIQAIKLYRDGSNCSLKEAKDYVERLEGIGNISQLKHNKTKFEGCFVATICYGDYNAPEVLLLREFRDNVLLNYVIGKIFVRLYYLFSPGLSVFINKSMILKSITKKYFLNVIIKLLSKYYANSK